MYAIVFMCVVGLAFGQLQLPHGHELKQLVDSGFARIDHSPKDGVVLENEWDVLIERDDADNDTCVTLQEYQAGRANAPAEVSSTLFAHFDVDHDGCLSLADEQAEFHLIDHNGDNQLTMHEFETYMTHLINHLFGHGAGHGNH